MLPALSSQNTTAAHTTQHNASANNGGSTAPKRNSSMIFRIEHLLPLAPTATTAPPAASPQNLDTALTHTAVTSFQSPTNGTRRNRAARSSGVYLKQFTAKDTISDSISTLALMSSNSSMLSDTAEQQLERSRSQQSSSGRTFCAIVHGVLRLTANIMRRVKLSEDIHSFNALFEAHNGDVRLRIVRDIARDEELIAWFDEELTILMSIPFLTPLNIQGNNRYTCHICQLTFETPNPLKIHLALACGRHSLDILWIRLHYSLKSTTFQQRHLPLPLLHHHLPPISPAALLQQRSTQITCASSTLTTISPISSPQQTQRFSAFKPISPSSAPQCSSSILTTSAPNAASPTTSTTSTTLGLPLMAHSTNAHAQFTFLPALSAAPMNLLQTPNSSSPLNAAAQIEAIVSNMGASKQGHLCIYCGKVYSRKYGLKIHIRTHTGFKPLKCKFCLRPFGDPSNLNKHVRLHLQSSGNNTTGAGGSGSSQSGETIDGYKCHLCHKTLARRRDLQRHIESRHNTASS